MATTRLDVLSRPKAFATGFEEDRRSVYWIDKHPPKAGGDGITVFIATPRVDELSQHKNYTSYDATISAPIWPVTMGAKNAEPSARTSSLAEPKSMHPEFRLDRSAHSAVTPGARSANPSARVGQLAQPKPHKTWGNSQDIEYRNMHYTKAISEISPTALKAVCSARVETLSSPKGAHPTFLGEKPVRWPVSDTARNASASSRVQQLARPKSRGRGQEEYNPYQVSAGAKSAQPSNRVTELATPLQRKVRQKKV